MHPGRLAEGRDVTARLLGYEHDSIEVDQEMENIRDALEVQSQGGGFSYKELLYNGPSQNLRRTMLAMLSQFFQQICGINLITYYATFVFENSLGFGPNLSRLLAACNGTEYFLASLIAIPLIERTGRRNLMLFGAFGMMASMAILAGTTSTGETLPNGAPLLSTKFGVVATVFLFGFNTFFAIGWLGMTCTCSSSPAPHLVTDTKNSRRALSRRDYELTYPDSSQCSFDVVQLAVQLVRGGDTARGPRSSECADIPATA